MKIERNEPDLVITPETKIDEDGLAGVNSESGLLWYVLQTKPMAEESVRQHLANARFEAFLPRIKTMVRGSGKSVSRIKTLFPSYLFARVNLRDPNLYRMIKYTRGVRKILGDGTYPVPVPAEMIEIIKERVGADGCIEQRLILKKGDAVRIRGGLFRDLIGILDRPVSTAGRVRVLLNIMRHQVKCDLSAAEVEKVTE